MKRLDAWQKKGKRISTYQCPHCKYFIPHAIPEKNDVSSKGFWDSATICIECGKLAFVTTYPSGIIKAVKI